MSRAQRLAVVLLLNLALVAGLVVVGLGAHSLGVLAAGVDYLADASAIGVSLLAIWLARRPGGRYRNATNVAAVINAGWMLVVSIAVVAGGVQRLVSGTPHVDGRPVLIASAVAAAAMLCGALVLREGTGGAGGEDLNVKAVLLDTAADAAAAGGVAITCGSGLV
jgi:cobalt-zinc-cadmium efflux system protein